VYTFLITLEDLPPFIVYFLFTWICD